MNLFVTENGVVYNIYQVCKLHFSTDGLSIYLTMSNQQVYTLSGSDAKRFKDMLSQVTNFDIVTGLN